MLENVSERTWKIVAVAGAAVVGALVLLRLTRTDPETERRREVVRKHFPQLSEAEVRELADQATEKHLVAGDQPVMEGEIAPNVYIIRAGEFELFKYQAADDSYPLVGVAGKGQTLAIECAFGLKGDAHAKVPPPVGGTGVHACACFLVYGCVGKGRRGW